MQKISYGFLLAAVIGVCLLSGASFADGYRVAPEDVLKVTVFDEPDLSLDEARIGSDGVIAMPLIGDVKVAGLTTEQIARRIERRLADGYLKKPRVSVAINEYRQFYVHGEVEKPGGYSYQDGLTVQRAIVLAGGFTERASESKITLAREGEPDRALSVGLDEKVHPGDVISVGESFF
jgi:polysaccharide biosynthesis/export protein VpsN